jgi:hypothetical protein
MHKLKKLKTKSCVRLIHSLLFIFSVINLFVINELYCIVFTDERQQRQPNHTTTALCLLTDDNNDNPIITRPHIVFTDGRQRQPNHNTTTYCVYWGTTTVLWLGCRCLPSVNTICGRIMIGLSLLSFVSKHNTVEFLYNEQVYNEIRLIAK